MSSKKIFIAIGLVAIVSISVIVLFLLSQKKETVSQEPTQNQESATPAALPSGTESSGNLENIGETRKIFENITQETISDEAKKEGLKRISFENKKGNPIPLSDFESVLGIKIDPTLREYLDNGYQVFYCPGTGGKKEFGVFLEYDMEKIYRGFSYDVLDMLKGWEAKIFPDLHAVLYPNSIFSEGELNRKIDFRDGKYRYAEVNLLGREKGSIQYEAIELGIIITTTPSCLDNAYQYYEPVEPY